MLPVISRRGGSEPGQKWDKSGAGGVPPSVHLYLVGAALATAARPRRRGAIYARYSSRYQHSIDDQVRDCRKWAEENGVEVLDQHVFVDEAKTGKTHKRKGLQQLSEAIANDEVDVLVVFATNRLFRKMYHALQFVEEEIIDCKKRCVFVKTGIDTDDTGRWRQLFQVNAMMDEMLLAGSVGHIRAAHEGKLRNGHVFGAVPYGHCGIAIPDQFTPRGTPVCKLAIDPEPAAHVQTVFQWFTRDGLSIAEIVRRLNAEGVPLPARSQSKRWTYVVVRRMLGNRRYIGTWQYGENETVWQNKAGYGRGVKRDQPLCEVQCEHLRIIDDATFDAAQLRLTEYGRRAGRRGKASNRVHQPQVLNGLVFREKHTQSALRVGGSKGASMFCPGCQHDPERALFTMLPRALATQLLLETLGRVIKMTPS